MAVATYDVGGMTCDHCARAVTEEIEQLDGVTGVAVDVAAGRVTVTTSGAPLEPAAVRVAIEEAGYQLVGA